MDLFILVNLFFVALFILLTGVFVGGEFAILKVRMSRIDQLIAEGNKKSDPSKKRLLITLIITCRPVS
ncbi:magnesium and cobalt efflux protein CorC [Geomicrobium sp. JCM 19055]|nr:magnesium and cobalt efflux protein CorC [Geomicrobium sp. JCM 19055]